jgi:hypothetical protein
VRQERGWTPRSDPFANNILLVLVDLSTDRSPFSTHPPSYSLDSARKTMECILAPTQVRYQMCHVFVGRIDVLCCRHRGSHKLCCSMPRGHLARHGAQNPNTVLELVMDRTPHGRVFFFLGETHHGQVQAPSYGNMPLLKLLLGDPSENLK